MRRNRTTAWMAMAVLALLALTVPFASAGDRVLSINSGDASSTWFVTGEPSLVMNGFDLTPLRLTLPITLDKASIAIDTAVPGALVDVVVYQDGNGGSPVDATLVGQTQVTINQPGVFTATFPTPLTISQPVVWVGFYLPESFRFLADRSGSSVLTYWAWTPGGRFDLSRLSSAGVLGPGDGSAPVSISMGGIARITAEISAPGGVLPTTIPVTLVSGTLVPGAATQIAVSGSADTSMMSRYGVPCETLSWDTADVSITFRTRVIPKCRVIWEGFAPAPPTGFQRRQLYYDLTFFTDRGAPISDKLEFPITHCIEPSPTDVNNAIFVLATGSPRQFTTLPTLRVGNLICAEIKQSGGLSYVVPG